jgi:hypothetical protein
MQIIPGDHLAARTARGTTVPRRAVSGVVAGNMFKIVWVCEESEYRAAASEHREPNATPWPANAVEKAADA